LCCIEKVHARVEGVDLNGIFSGLKGSTIVKVHIHVRVGVDGNM
jgi:hypothetical protein